MKSRYLLFGLAFICMIGCKSSQILHSSTAKSPLFKVAILYPNGEGKTFDMDYYEKKHMPMVASFLGGTLEFYEIDKGISGRTPTDTAPYMAVGYFYIKDVSTYNIIIGQNRDAIISDFKNYTNIQPIIQISEVKYVSLKQPK